MTTPKPQKIEGEEEEQIKNPYKNHECDGGDDYGIVDCLKCEREMLWNLRQERRKHHKFLFRSS